MDNVSELHRPIDFTIDGRAYATDAHKQRAADLLRLGGLDPNRFDLGELPGSVTSERTAVVAQLNNDDEAPDRVRSASPGVERPSPKLRRPR